MNKYINKELTRWWSSGVVDEHELWIATFEEPISSSQT